MNGAALSGISPPPRQAEVLRYLAGYLEQHGYAPSFDEICIAVGMTNRGAVSTMMAKLEERGLIDRIGHRSRAIEPKVRIAVPRAPDGAPLYFINAEQLERGHKTGPPPH